MAPAPYTGLQTGLAMQDLPKPHYNYEVQLVGNRLPDGRHIVGLMFLAQHSLHDGQGFITAVNFADGSVTVDGITRVKINDPIGRFSVGIPDAQNPDKRFTIDEDNPTVRASSSYPMCVPRSAADALCPQKNRPLSPVDGVTPSRVLHDAGDGGDADAGRTARSVSDGPVRSRRLGHLQRPARRRSGSAAPTCSRTR